MDTLPTGWSLMIDLDSLFDTRFSILMEIDPRKTLILASRGDYFRREYETFDGIDMDEFNQRYRNRTVDTLRKSKITRILPILQSYLVMNDTITHTTPGMFTKTLLINCYPYTLSEYEMDHIATILYYLLGKSVSIRFINADDSQLTPTWLKDHVGIMIRYDYPRWLETHGRLGTFDKSVCPSVHLLGPRIVFGTLDSACPDTDHFFSLVETATAPICALGLIPVEFFCINVEFKKES